MVLGKTLAFRGELSADEDLLLLGRLTGSLHHTGSVTVGVGGVVHGDIRARTITIKGTIEGDLHASESVLLAPSALVTGDIIAPRVMIVEGGTFNGSVEMPLPAPDAQAVPAQSPAPATGDTVLAAPAVQA